MINGSGSGRPKNLWILGIRNTAFKFSNNEMGILRDRLRKITAQARIFDFHRIVCKTEFWSVVIFDVGLVGFE
jgi:hypothetical protein